MHGEDVHRLRPKFEDSLETLTALAENVPEFAVRVSLSTGDRTAYATAATRLLQAKNLRLTRDSVSLLYALAGSPYAAAQALQQLAGEDERRELRPDELRYALGTLEPEQLLSDLPPAVGRIVQTLRTAEGRLSQRELADRADVSTRMIRRYRDRLEPLDLIWVDDTGYRLALSFQTATDRRNPLFQPFSRRGRRSSIQPMHCSGRFSRQIATATPTTRLGVRCFGHRIHRDYSSIG